MSLQVECQRCREPAYANCRLCEERPAFCLDHWLGHLESKHAISNEAVQQAADDFENRP